MSLAVLARKTRTTAPRFRRDKCFVLNMTGRGQVIGQSAKSHNSKCKTKQGCKDGHVSRCCGAANSLDLSGCKSDCWRGKGSRPAPQLSYSNYLNRRSLGSYRPGGGVCCDTSGNQKTNKITWKQGPSISASEMIQQRKDKSIACWKQRYIKKYSIKNIDKFQSEPTVVKWYWNDDINYWKQRVGKCLDVIIEVEKTSEKTKPCAVKTISGGNNISGRSATDLVSYTRINHVSCGTTKALPYSSSGDQIAFRRTTQSCPKYGLASFKRPMNTYKQKL